MGPYECYNLKDEKMKKAILIVGLILLIYLVVTYIRFRGDASRARELIDEAVPYEQHPAGAAQRVLFLGDSSAAGTGASEPKYSTAGRHGAKYPNSDITNVGVNGARLGDVKNQLARVSGQKFDLVIAQVGGNDILHFTTLTRVESGLNALVAELKNYSDKIILIHGGNMGASPAFPFGTRALYSWRTRQVREIYLKAEKDEAVRYVDLYTSLKDFPQTRNGRPTSAADGFHPSDEGYAIWFEHIDKTLSD